METIIKTESLTKIYNPLSLNPKLALDQVSLDVKEGEFIAIMGKSGSVIAAIIMYGIRVNAMDSPATV